MTLELAERLRTALISSSLRLADLGEPDFCTGLAELAQELAQSQAADQEIFRQILYALAGDTTPTSLAAIKDALRVQLLKEPK